MAFIYGKDSKGEWVKWKGCSNKYYFSNKKRSELKEAKQKALVDGIKKGDIKNE